MHIVINGWFVGESTAGMGQYVDRLLAVLARQAPAVRFSLLLPQRPNLPPLVTDWPGIEVILLALPPLPKNLAKLWWEQVTVPWTARRLGADRLWVPYWAAPFWQPIPTVVTVHDLIPVLLPAYRGGRLSRLYTTLVSMTARRATAVITISAASKRDLVEYLHIPAERVFVVYHGPNVADPQPAAAGLALQLDNERLDLVQQKYQLPDRFFLYLGGFDVRKNVGGILRAYRRYLERGGDPTVRLVIAGRLPTHDTPFAPDPQKIAAEAGLTEQVRFCGWVDEQDKPALYALATAYFFPSLYEGFGMMLLEAMAAGTPVVTSARVDG